MPLVTLLVILAVCAFVLCLSLVLALWMHLPLIALGVAFLGLSFAIGMRSFSSV